MKNLQILSKYSTRIILISILCIIITFSVSSYNSSFNQKLNDISGTAEIHNAEVKVKSYPVISDDRVILNGVITSAENDALKGAGVSLYLYAAEGTTIYPGDTLTVSGECTFPAIKRNVGGFDNVRYFKGEKLHMRVSCFEGVEIKHKSSNRFMKTMTALRTRFIKSADKYLPARQASIAKALVTGERNSIVNKDATAFKRSGVYHIVAISGLHLNIFIMIFSRYIASLKIRRRKKAYLSAAVCTLAGGFVLVFTGFGTSVIRAFTMLVISLGSAVFSRKYSSKNSLMMAAALILILMPRSFFSVGFALSVLSTLGVLITADLVKKAKENENLTKIFSYGFVSTALTSFICAAVTLPVTADSFGYIAVYSALANILILPLMAPCLGGCILFGITAIAGLDFIAELISYPLTGIIHIVISIAEFVSSLPLATINLYTIQTVTAAAAVAVVLLCAYLMLKNHKIAAIFTAVVFVVAGSGCFVYNRLSDEAKVTFLYSGQGDCALVRMPHGKNIMVDFGTSQNSAYTEDEIKSSLIKYSVRRLEAVFVSHYHADHISGVISLVDEGRVKRVYVPEFFEATDEESEAFKYELLAAASKTDTQITYLKGENTIKIGSAVFDVVSPEKELDMDANNMSAVVKMKYGKTKFLFTGDLEKPGIKQFYDKDLSCDVLKIPHHGSKSSNDELFLSLAKPKYAIISCGENNFYGHPHKSVTDLLKEENIKTYRTDLSGAVTFCINKETIKSINTMR